MILLYLLNGKNMLPNVNIDISNIWKYYVWTTFELFCFLFFFELEENFSHLGSTLKIVQNYLKSSECQIEPNLSMILIKQLDEKLKQFQEDQKEYMLLKNVKNVKVSVKPIPRCWKCLTWKQMDEKISLDNVPDSSLKPKNPFCESNNIYEKLYNNNDANANGGDVKCVCGKFKNKLWQMFFLLTYFLSF